MGHGSLRSRPVSCLFCRSRKLRCSRLFPCANCTSRGISCQGEAPEKASAVSTSSTDEVPDTSNSNKFQEDVLARLRRLENIVIGQSEKSHPSLDQTGSRPWGPQPRHRGDLTASFPGKLSLVDSERIEAQIINPGASSGLCITEYGKNEGLRLLYGTHTYGYHMYQNSKSVLLRIPWLPTVREPLRIIQQNVSGFRYTKSQSRSSTCTLTKSLISIMLFTSLLCVHLSMIYIGA